MAWVWHMTPVNGFPDAKIDYLASRPTYSSIAFDTYEQAQMAKSPVFKTRAKLKRFVERHSPAIGVDPVADDVWQSIICKFAPERRVAFIPLELRAADGITHKFSWVVCCDQVECIDLERSKTSSEITNKNGRIIFDFDKYVHHKNCMNGLHIARDKNFAGHIVVSNELCSALAATGESSMFYQPEDVPTLFGKNSVLQKI
jgi:hypothetical protein